MRWPLVWRRRIEGDLSQEQAQRAYLERQLDEARAERTACASQLERVAHELSRGKDVIATHMVWAGHPSTVLHSPQECMESLHEALEAVGFHLRLELARIEGSQP